MIARACTAPTVVAALRPRGATALALRTLLVTAPLAAASLTGCGGALDGANGLGLAGKDAERASLSAAQRLTSTWGDRTVVLLDEPVASPSPVPNQTRETFVVEAPTHARNLRLHFAAIDLEPGYDYLTIESRDGEVLQRVTGRRAGFSVVVEGNAAWLVLETDQSVRSRGFYVDAIDYQEGPLPGGFTNEPHGLGEVRTAAPYGNRVRERYEIAAPRDAVAFRVNFEHFDVEADYDVVHLYDGAGQRIWSISGGHAGLQSPTVFGTTATLELVTDGSVTGEGFLVTSLEVLRDQQPCICPAVIMPVCADGVTYQNECRARCAGAEEIVDGVCEEEDCICPAVIDPVCGDGQTYQNECRARCDGATDVVPGACEEPCLCPTVAMPVCGDGETFINECEANCAGAEEIVDGACETTTCANVRCADGTTCEMVDGGPVCVEDEPVGCACPRIYDPVCGSDGVTYGNSCEAACADITEHTPGECPTITCANVRCAAGTHCEMVEVQCVTQPCPPQPQCVDDEPADCFCQEIYAPVCGADLETYGNACEAECAGTGVFYEGPCASVDCASVLCAPGTTCEMVEVDCGDDALCPREPQCTPLGLAEGDACDVDAEPCGGDLRCRGLPARCWEDGASREGEPCATDAACEGDGVCAGLAFGDEGICVPSWMRGSITDDANAAIPDDDEAGIVRTLEVTGLASVVMDAWLTLDIDHTWRGDLRVTLTNPDGTERVVHDRAGGSADDLELDRVAVPFPSDESVNGTWTLRVSDNAGQDIGTLVRWGLTLSSRWD